MGLHLCIMARFPRVVATGLSHHVTQRGNARRVIFESDADRLVYLQLLQTHCRLHRLSVLGFCLMSNPVHLILVPSREEAIGLALRNTHGRYATYLNARQGVSGHVWQGRFYSCPLDAEHLWAALRYTERNPVRAGLVDVAEQYRWSSAALHCGARGNTLAIDVDLEPWRAVWSVSAWRTFLDDEPADADGEALRVCTHTGRPLGSSEFVTALERTLHRPLRPRKGGRPKKEAEDPAQTIFTF